MVGCGLQKHFWIHHWTYDCVIESLCSLTNRARLQRQVFSRRFGVYQDCLTPWSSVLVHLFVGFPKQCLSLRMKFSATPLLALWLASWQLCLFKARPLQLPSWSQWWLLAVSFVFYNNNVAWFWKIRGTQRQFSENICSEDDLRSRFFRNICCKIHCLPAFPGIFEHLKNCIIALF